MNRRFFTVSAATALFFTAFSAIAQEAKTPNLEIVGAFARASPKMAAAGAGFMTIKSLGESDRLIGFSSPACNQPELHTHIHDDGMMRMRQVESIDVPAGGEVKLEPGSFHLMLIGLNGVLTMGENVDVTLVFEKAGAVNITLPIKKSGAMN